MKLKKVKDGTETTYDIGNVKFTIFDSFSQERYRAINKIFINAMLFFLFIVLLNEVHSMK